MEKPLEADSTINKKASDIRKRGVFVATLSGIAYGNYTAFMTLAMTLGIWSVWNGEQSHLSGFSRLFLISALGAATTDICSASWALGIAIGKGKLKELLHCINSKTGVILVGAALIGGPLASTCYVFGLESSGAVIIPISALCPAIGAVLSRLLFRQALTARIILGIAVCFLASAIIGCSGLSADAPPNLFLGLFFGFLAALGWGLEGCVGGYATSIVDHEISITIRQVTSALCNLCIFVPFFSIICGVSSFEMISLAFLDTAAMPFFLVGGIAAYYAFGLWYKGNAMCGTALGMACNGMYSFWGPFFCWVLLGICYGHDGFALAPIVWLAAVVMVIGIFIIAVNPLAFLRKKN